MPIRIVNGKQRKLAAVVNWYFNQLENAEVFSKKIWHLWQTIAKYTDSLCYTRVMY